MVKAMSLMLTAFYLKLGAINDITNITPKLVIIEIVTDFSNSFVYH